MTITEQLHIPAQVYLHIKNHVIRVRGPLGTLYVDIYQWTPKTHSFYHTALKNAIQGVSQGFFKKLKIQGSGYRVVLITETHLTLRLGYSHDTVISIPKNTIVRSNRYNQLLCMSINKEALSVFCSQLKKLRTYNSYRQKGIFDLGKPIAVKQAGKPGIKHTLL